MVRVQSRALSQSGAQLGLKGMAPAVLPAPLLMALFLVWGDLHPERNVTMSSTLGSTQKLPDYPAVLDNFIGSRLPDWLSTASADVLKPLCDALEKHQRQQEDLAQLLAGLQAPLEFAAPLLEQALLEHMELRLDPLTARWKEVRVHQGFPNFWSAPGSAVNLVRTEVDSPLLQRALQNFSKFEAGRGGLFEGTSILSGEKVVSDEPERFATMCRKLDLGQQYQAHLETLFSPTDDVLRRERQELLINEQCNKLEVLTHASYLKKDIDETAYRMLLEVVQGRTNVKYAEHEVLLRSIKVLGLPVRGAVVFLARGEHLPHAVRWNEASLVRQVVLYLPGDPERPLRQFANWFACATDLGLSLKSTDFQDYFQQMIGLDSRQRFLAALQPQLQVARAELELTDDAISGELFFSLAQAKIAGIKKDAAAIAVPTAQVDSAAAESRQQVYLAIGETFFGLALSFVPGVGQVMLGAAITQLLGEVYEGVAEWSRGQREQALAHLTGVAQSLVASAALGAGATALVALAKRSAFIDGLLLVARSSGQYRLWNDDLSAYRYTRVLGDSLPRRSDGLIEDADGLWLRHEGHSYQVQAREGSWTLRHPQREQAYAPILGSNGEGAWRLPGEHPLQWSGSPYLVRRLGPLGEGMSDAQVAQMMVIADMSEDQLRYLHVENQPMPTRLRDTLERFAIDDRIELFSQHLHQQDSPHVLDPQLYRYCQDHLVKAPAQAQKTELEDVREQMPRLRFALFEHLHEQTLVPADDSVNLLLRDFPGLPQRYAQALIEQAETAQLQALKVRQRIPLALAELARHSLRQARLNRALEGLWLHNVYNIDTVRLAFGLLRRMPNWPLDLNLELRAGSSSGRLLERQLPLSDTRQTRVLVRREGRFAVYDAEGYELEELIPEPQGLFDAIAFVLSPEQRQALGWGSANSAEEIRQTLLTLALSQRAEAARLIGQVEPSDRFNPPQRLPDGRIGYPLSGRGSGTHNPLASLVRSLYPGFNASQVDVFLAHLEGGVTEPLIALGRLLEQLHILNSHLSLWCQQVTGVQRAARSQVAGELRRCWRLQSQPLVSNAGAFLGYRLSLPAVPVGRLPRLPTAVHFSHVTSLTLTGMELTDSSDGFLQRFFNVRWLNLASNRFATIPAALLTMPRLSDVNLSGNQINLTGTGAGRLSALTGIEVLNLENNPLSTLPDLSGMFHLRRLYLRNTQQQQFPAGLSSHLFLILVDLRDNQITALPDDFFETMALDEFLLERNPLPQAVLDRLTEAPGGDGGEVGRAFTFEQSRALWLELSSDTQRQARGQRWDNLIAESQATDFFQLLTEMTGTADFRLTRAELDRRVWSMLEAMAQSTILREELFTLAASPVTCVDSVSSSFSTLEVRFLLFQAVQSDSAPESQGTRLLRFSRRLFRLDQVERFARADMQSRIEENRGVDEIEVSLAYRTRLAAPLDLPGQPRNMQFAEVAAVTPAQVTAALNSVRTAERSDQLASFISGRDFWQAHLRHVHHAEFEQTEQGFWDRLDTLQEQLSTLPEGQYLEQANSLAREREAALQALALRLTQEALRSASQPGTPMA